MNERKRPERPRDIDVRREAGIVRSPIDEIKAIQVLLADVYKDAGDGRTLFRELVQNADDSGARRLRFAGLEGGWPDARNSLLHGPALLVANDGPFPDKDRDALHMAIGGSKEDDVAKIGTFGIGLKSVFHICEAFLYIGAAQSEWLAGVLNPWFGTGEGGHADPLHADWDVIGEQDLERLRIAMTDLLGETGNGLLLWIPLRRNEHLDRGVDGRRYGLGDHCPESQEICSWFSRSTPAALLLAQCGNLQTIDTKHSTKPERLSDGKRLMSVTRADEGWLGRYPDENRQFGERAFAGEISSNVSKWCVTGLESLGSRRLRDLRSQPDWPQSPDWQGGQYGTVPRKALAHAAVTVLRPVDPDVDILGTRLRWAAFLPLDDDPAPSSSAIVESDGRSPAWEIILHGYFWPSQDRKSIPGVTDERGDATHGGGMRSRWNRTLCECLLLPLLPCTLAEAVTGVSERAARTLLSAVAGSDIVKQHLTFITRRHWLLPVVAADGVQWKARDAAACPVLSIPNWRQAPETVCTRFLASCREYAGHVVFIDDDAPGLTGELADWAVEHLECLLNSIPIDAFASKQSLRWIEGVVPHVLGPDARAEDPNAAAFAQWLAGQIGEGALAPTIRRSASRETQDGLREAWRRLCAAIPRAWLVETPVGTLRAVVELAEDGVVGEGLFLLPVGRPRGGPEPTRIRDKEPLDRALTALGQRLEAGGESERTRHSRLLLAETLLSIRPYSPVAPPLSELPFLRATSLPEDKEEAWRIADLHRQIENLRVFASPGSSDDSEDESTSGMRPERSSGSKHAVRALAMALEETVWWIDGDAIASITTDVPSPEPETLAGAVLQAKEFAPPARRALLLRRLASDISGDTNVHLAARALLAGCAGDVVGSDTELFLVRAGTKRALVILLRLLDRSWCAVDRRLASSLPQDTLEALSVGEADLAALHRLLNDCLGGSVDWTSLNDEEALHLLQRLYGAEPEVLRGWREMPLHRAVDGKRVVFDDRARLSAGKASEFVLPAELRGDVCLLDPDPDVAHLYDAVPNLDRDGILQLMLEDSRPWRFAKRIVRSVRPTNGPVRRPADVDLRLLLRTSCWLPDRNGEGVAPDAVLLGPGQVLNVVADLAEEGAFGDKRLPDAVDPQIWSMAKPVVRDVHGRLGRVRQVERMVDALDADRVAQVQGGAWLIMPEPSLVDTFLITMALQTTLAGGHPGWRLVHRVHQILQHGDTQPNDALERLLLRLAKSLCAPIPAERQVEMLERLAASRPAKDSPSGWTFRRLLSCFAGTAGFFEDVLPKLHLPTQDGNWHASGDIATTETGVARRHLLISELRPILGLDDDDRLTQRNSVESKQPVRDPLRQYFEPWRNRLPHGAVGAFLSLLGSGSRGEIAKLAEEWLGEDLSIDGMRSDLVDPDGEDPCADICVWVSSYVQSGPRVLAVNVLGERVEMEAEPDPDTLFATDPVRYPGSALGIAPREPFTQVELRDVDAESRTSSELIHMLGRTVERWATRYLKLDRDRVKEWWARWGERSAADLRPVLASITAHLPLTLQQLDVKDNEPLRDALREAEQAQRKREQVPSRDTLRIERECLDRLASLIKEPEHQTFLWLRVNELMRRYGYGNDSVLLELAQNADDALAQAAEIKGGPVPCSARRFLVRVHEDGGTPTVDVMHWGRPINDTGGAAFPAGRDRQWDQDLYFMLLMNLSGKPGEAPGQASLSSTTGRFGLGFKSVHLLSASPFVVSGFIAFSIAGGLLPVEQAVPKNADSWLIERRRATRVRLPLRRDVDANELIQSLFRRFSYARALLPVFSRQLREVVVEGGPFPGIHAFDGTPIEGTSAWSIGTETALPNHDGHWRVLRFRPADSGRRDMGTAALAIGLRDGVPTAFASDVPFLWNVTPTSEKWACGYAVNGPFKLDPGRTHVSLDEDATLEAVGGLGEELGKGLIELHDLLTGPGEAAYCPMLGSDGQSVLSSLWEVLASGTDNPDTLRRSFLLRLHGNGRGISAWMAARPVVPTRLPEPFPPLLPPLSSEMSWEVATGGLHDPDLCAVLARIDDEDFRSLVGARRVVSEETNRRLVALSTPAGTDSDLVDPAPLRPADLLEELAEKWEYRLTPTRLHAVRPLSQAAAWSRISNDPHGARWRGGFRARSVAGTFEPLQGLLVQRASALQHEADGDLDDEVLRSAFAPSNRVLDSAYIERREDWTMFRWLRVHHRVDAVEIANWYVDVREDLRPAALRYLLDGKLQDPVLRNLMSLRTRPPWLQDFDGVRQMLKDICKEPWRRRSLLGALFPDRFHVVEPPLQPPVDSDMFFKQLSEWWDDAVVRSEVIAAYEEEAWPEWLRRGGGISVGLREGSKDHWLALLILGACRGLGRTQDTQHRGFLELVHRREWWNVFKAPEDAGAWMEMLRDWQDEALAKLAYPPWMSLFPAIYQLSRYRDVYVRLLKSSGQRPRNMYDVSRLLAPRVDEALTGAGAHFDAPPAPLGMGLHWVLRELVRLEVVEGEHVYPDCWVPSEQVLRFLRNFGLDRPDDGVSNPQKARAIFDFLASELGTTKPNLHLAFDIPIRYVASNPELRRRFGLEQ
ncbi:sacsin N-terminal ATP-binding-like domain-containing protein [Candidatus Palauibacter sp.]|uniref:sacsin N-terminal ATP-binding-like domain-containing protein n=1 Tax=Candidatus Palauibacter sp. TaxID=3101350 RepID=UPI003B022DBE